MSAILYPIIALSGLLFLAMTVIGSSDEKLR